MPGFFVLPAAVRGACSLLLYGANTLFWVPPVVGLALFKRLVRRPAWRSRCDRLQNAMADLWISGNIFNQRLFSSTRFNARIPDALDRRGWYLVIANHQSWVDILVLQRIFHRKIPFLKFFLKKELLWLPILGQAWWALDFPFMKRYPKRYLKRHPERVGTDLDITRSACEKFKTVPVSVMSFVEGTRFSEKKRDGQKSPYQRLLRARAGGVAHVLAAMNGRIQKILDVTIVYPEGRLRFWDFVCGRIAEIRVRVEAMPVDESLLGDYARDRRFRRRFQGWLNDLWKEKDARMQRLSASSSDSGPTDSSPLEASMGVASCSDG